MELISLLISNVRLHTGNIIKLVHEFLLMQS